jgi:hypothetical protein
MGNISGWLSQQEREDALEGVFGDGGKVTVCSAPAGRGRDERAMPGVRDFT